MFVARTLLRVQCLGSMQGICIPRHSGKSTLCNSLDSTEYHIVDLEELCRLQMTDAEKQTLEKMGAQSVKSYSLHYFPLARKYLDELRKSHKGKKFLVVASSVELLKYCKIKNIRSYVPSNELTRRLQDNLVDQEARLFATSRVDIMLQSSKKALNSFNAFDDMIRDVANFYKLQQRL